MQGLEIMHSPHLMTLNKNIKEEINRQTFQIFFFHKEDRSLMRKYDLDLRKKLKMLQMLSFHYTWQSTINPYSK